MASKTAQAAVKPLDLAAPVPSTLFLVLKASPFDRTRGHVLAADARRIKIGRRADPLLSTCRM